MNKAASAARVIEFIMTIIFFLCGIASILCTVVISFYMIVSGAPAIQEIGLSDFLLGTQWAPTAAEPSFGILALILSSICGTAGAVLIGVPLGVFCAVFIQYFAPKRLSKLLTAAIELLAGIPSVVFGLVGMLVVVPTVAKIFRLASGANLLSAILILSIMILPTIVSITMTSLKAVPEEYSNGSLALGATQVMTIFKMNIPAAKSGIITGIVLGVGRAIGETMAIIMVSGNVTNMPELFGSVRFLTTGIVSEMSYAVGLHSEALFSIGLVLFCFILLINFILTAVLKQAARKSS
jgi:phosphate transport system permease protein